MIDDRTARVLLGRLNQARWREAMERVCARSWLDAAPLVSWRGIELTRFTRGAAVNELAAVAAARRAHDDQPDVLGLGASSAVIWRNNTPGLLVPGEEVDVDDAGFDAALSAAGRGTGDAFANSSAFATLTVDDSDFEIEELVAAARSRAEPLKVEEVAGALLVAKAVGKLGVGLGVVLDALKGARPIVVLVSPVIGFQVVFQRMVEDGLIPLGACEFRSIASLERSRLASARTTVRGSLVNIPITPGEPPSKWVLSKAFESHLPILIEAPSLDVIPQRLQDAATLILDTGPLDAHLIRRMVEILRGLGPGATINDDDCRNLDLVDLRMAFRPGLHPDEIINTLRRYGRENRAEEDPSVDDRPDRREPRSGSSFRTRSSAPASTVIEPSADPAAPRVEALAGYGEALTWAEDLKLDLDDWREGRLVWADLSPRLLLSGPPGTGKTTWAKALCNSLQLPLLATSAADWLTGGHLGDVLAAMDRAFADAVRRAPCILFVDEVDGIGTRERSVRDHDDYWTSIVNKALQLMDGAIRTEGVILIGASNRPEALDPALRRAGRLERHITILKPDTATLAAILAHHLGDDLQRLCGRPRDDGGGDMIAKNPAAGTPATDLDGVAVNSRGSRSSGPSSPSMPPILVDLARKAAGSTGADIEHAVRLSRGNARRERRPLTMQDVETSLVGGRPQLGPALRRRFAVHEAGHAVVAQALNLGKVVSVSIDVIEGGTTVIRRSLDRDQDEAYFTDELIFTMAGRAAEAVLLGSIGAGSGALLKSDLDRATRLAAALEGSMGYGGQLPLLFHGEDLLRLRLLQDRDFAAKVHGRIVAAEDCAKTMVIKHVSAIDLLSGRLVADGVVECL